MRLGQSPNDASADGHTLAVLEFHRLKAILREHAQSEPGREVLDGLHPLTDFEDIAGRLARAREMTTLVNLDGGPSVDDIVDVEPLVELASKSGSSLSALEILHIGRVLRAGRLARGYLLDRRDTARLLAADAEPVASFREMEKRIFRSFDAGGNVLDEASDRLAAIRAEGSAARRHIVTRLGALFQDPAYRAAVQEDLVTQRAGRYVIPLKAGASPHEKGIVHDRSASGATFFVEPLEVVQENNRIAIMAAEEKAEIDRILALFTRQIGAMTEGILSLLHLTAQTDALAAIGRFSAATRATVPEVTASGEIRFLGARHPLLPGTGRGQATVIPLDLELNKDVSVLLISGPNAGGKTVALKTVGIVILMLRSGIPAPVSPDSRVPLFGKVFADIGDEQSLDESLSTYSGHIRRMGRFLAEADDNTLVLLDEMGAGTDPEEGGALAASILEGFRDRGALCIVTTHVGFLKETAARSHRMLNASMAFDPGTGRPTFRMVIGQAGTSNPIMVAREMGLPPDLLGRATALMDGRKARLEELIEDLGRERAKLEEDRQREGEAMAETERLLGEAREREAKGKGEARRIRELAKRESAELLKRVRQLIKDAEHAAHATAADGAAGDDTASIDALRAEEAEVSALSHTEHLLPRGTSEYRPSVGDWVRVIPFSQMGRVSAIFGNTAEVTVGALKAKVATADLEPVGAQVVQRTHDAFMVNRSASTDDYTSTRLTLLGCRVEEALGRLDAFLDQSSLAGLHQVTVVHGIGTGALKAAIKMFLTGHVHVADIRPGEQAEGGAGVTVVRLR